MVLHLWITYVRRQNEKVCDRSLFFCRKWNFFFNPTWRDFQILLVVWSTVAQFSTGLRCVVHFVMDYFYSNLKLIPWNEFYPDLRSFGQGQKVAVISGIKILSRPWTKLFEQGSYEQGQIDSRTQQVLLSLCSGKVGERGGGGSVHMLHQKILASYKGIIIEATICLIPHICIGKWVFKMAFQIWLTAIIREKSGPFSFRECSEDFEVIYEVCDPFLFFRLTIEEIVYSLWMIQGSILQPLLQLMQ